jgi:hypothetical protein
MRDAMDSPGYFLEAVHQIWIRAFRFYVSRCLIHGRNSPVQSVLVIKHDESRLSGSSAPKFRVRCPSSAVQIPCCLGSWREFESRAGLWSGRVILEIKAAVIEAWPLGE